MPTDLNDRRYFLLFILLYALIYMGNAVYGTFIPVYLNHIGLSNAAVGLLLALGPFVAMFAQPAWGLAADRVRAKNTVLKLLFLGSAATVMLYPVSHSFLYLLLAFALFPCFQTSISPVSDAVTLEYLDASHRKFGHIRMAGTLGYAVMSVIAGVVASRYIDGIFPLYFVIYLLGTLVVFRLPKIRGHQSETKKVSPLLMLRNKPFMLLMALNLVVQTTLGYYYSFFPIYFKQLGAGSTILGWSALISSVSEVPFLLFADRILKKVGVRKTLVASSVLMAIRWLLMFCITDPYLMLAVQLLHGTNFIVFSFSLAVYINDKMPKELKASGQAMSGIVTFGLSRILGSIFGGLFSDSLGLRRMFGINAAVVAVSALLFGLIFYRNARAGQGGAEPHRAM